MEYIKKDVQNPTAEYLFKLQRIIVNTEFKNSEEAARYETPETKMAGGDYCRAVLKIDNFDNYTFSRRYVYSVLLAAGIPEDKINLYLDNPIMIPQVIKNKLVEEGRAVRIAGYVERNKYYANLAGLPFVGNKTTPADIIVTVPDEFVDRLNDPAITRNQAIHTMPSKYQELFMNSEYYAETIAKFPKAEYLKYIGSNAIPIEVSRRAKDGDILRINTSKLSAYHPKFGNVTVAPDVINQFVNSYNDIRNYVYNTLRGDFSGIYANYNNFIRFLTIYLSMGNALLNILRRSSTMAFMNNSTANEYFVLYGLPSSIMEGSSLITFLKKFRLLLMDKGTSSVYRVKDYIGYEYTDIYTLVMVKQQVFENGVPMYKIDENGKRVPVQKIVFRRLGTKDDDTSYFKYRESDVEYDWRDIQSGDPRWWNTPETEQMLNDMNYTLSNSKYIELSTAISMSDIFWQCIILLRGILDKKDETQFITLNINYDVHEIPLYDAVLTLVVLMNMHVNGEYTGELQGTMYLPNANGLCVDMLFNGLNDEGKVNPKKEGLPFKISSFNFNGDETDFYHMITPDGNNVYPDDYEYLDPAVMYGMLKPIFDNTNNNVGDELMNDIYAVYKYLEEKLQTCRTIHEFRQVTDAVKALFLVDPYRPWSSVGYVDVDKTLMEDYDLTSIELNDFKRYTTQKNITVTVPYDDAEIIVNIGEVMNTNVTLIKILGEYPFTDNNFVAAFLQTMLNYKNAEIEISELPASIKENYQGIISDKVVYDTENTTSGATTFASLLRQTNPDMYRRIIEMRGDPASMIMLLKSIIKGLEVYTNSSLNALLVSAVGYDEYITPLKEILTYFKSYMVEFTKDEFAYVMNGLFDQGGNSNMLKMFDEIHHVDIEFMPTDSLTLFDVSNSTFEKGFADNNIGFIYDEAQFHAVTTYANAKNMGYEIWFDYGDKIVQTEPDNITDASSVTINLVKSGAAYKIIIPVENIGEE